MAQGHQIGLSSLVNMALSLYDTYKKQQNAKAMTNILSDTASATGQEDINFIQKTLPTYGLSDPYSTMALSKHLGEQGNLYALGEQGEETNKTIGKYISDYADYAETMKQEGKVASPGDFVQQYAERYGGIGPEMMKKAGESVTQGLTEAENVADKAFTNKRQETLDTNQQAFLSAVTGLLDKSTAPAEVAANRGRGGYANPNVTLSDVLSAGKDYPPGTAMLNDVLGRVTQAGKETYPPEMRKTEKVGKTTATIDYNLFGEPKRVEQYTQPTFKVTVNTGSDKAKKEFRAEQKILNTLEKDYNTIATKSTLYPEDKATKAEAMKRIQAAIDFQRGRMSESFPDQVKNIPAPAKKVVRTGVDKQGRKVAQYDDGSVEYVK